MKQQVPSPEERTDLYDGYDCQGPQNPASDEYWDEIFSAVDAGLKGWQKATKDDTAE